MRRATVVATLLAVGMIGLGTWGVVRLRHALSPGATPVPTFESEAARSATALARARARGGGALPEETAPPPGGPVDASRFKLTPQPPPPAAGSPAREPYLRALAAGDERGLAAVRQAQAVARAATADGAKPPDDAYQKGLQQMEEVYSQRLERHRRALASTARPAAPEVERR